MDNFFIIKNFKSSQPQGCCGVKFSLASNLPHILGYSKVSLILLVFITILSCTNDKRIFTRDELNAIDSLYKLELANNKEKLDSLCDSLYQVNYSKMVDSIKVIRRREILDLLNK